MTSEAAISIKSLSKQYGSFQALHEIDLEISKGEFFALLGQNGAGKSTTINILTGLGNKTSGEVKLFGKDVVSEYKEARKLIGLVPQEFNMDQFEQVYRFLWFNAGYFGIARKDRKARIDELLKQLGLWEKRDAKIMMLSGGMKRKLMIARALLHNPEILILDEPTAGVDVEARKSMWKFLTRLNKEEQKTILLTTHYIEEAQELCERIAVIHHGKIIALDEKEAIMKRLGTATITVELAGKSTKIPRSLAKYNPIMEGKVLSIPITAETFDYSQFIKDLALVKITHFETTESSLEEIFVGLTKETFSQEESA